VLKEQNVPEKGSPKIAGVATEEVAVNGRIAGVFAGSIKLRRQPEIEIYGCLCKILSACGDRALASRGYSLEW